MPRIQRFVALNGGPHFTFIDGISLEVECASEDEVDDYYWERLGDGGTGAMLEDGQVRHRRTRACI